jgi:hypothetical protein
MSKGHSAQQAIHVGRVGAYLLSIIAGDVMNFTIFVVVHQLKTTVTNMIGVRCE